jgi:hypothetical protein
MTSMSRAAPIRPPLGTATLAPPPEMSQWQLSKPPAETGPKPLRSKATMQASHHQTRCQEAVSTWPAGRFAVIDAVA